MFPNINNKQNLPFIFLLRSLSVSRGFRVKTQEWALVRGNWHVREVKDDKRAHGRYKWVQVPWPRQITSWGNCRTCKRAAESPIQTSEEAQNIEEVDKTEDGHVLAWFSPKERKRSLCTNNKTVWQQSQEKILKWADYEFKKENLIITRQYRCIMKKIKNCRF